jgi:2-polyprenyl-3-methyl-5-hydroxy-6-metoxy-1,4-benzoquinol methylase
MLRSIAPFIRGRNFLELGSSRGDFTERLGGLENITCVEASAEAIEEARKKVDVTIIHSLFETVKLPEKYDNIFLIHTLEHLDNPISTLQRINNEWLSDIGRLFLICPNANALSRQIAVRMGLISHTTAVTESEYQHGHRITYTMDTLERDAKFAGLNIVHRSGIFLKALANFQWDQVIPQQIVSEDYLEGCYSLGQQYPDLCSSIFLVCEKGK